MEDLTIKPRDSSSRIGAVRRAGPVRTELAPSQSVTPAPAAPTSLNGDMLHGDTPDHGTPPEFLLDQQSQKLLDRERDIAGRNPRRESSQALLRMRAYGRPPQRHDEPDDDSGLQA